METIIVIKNNIVLARLEIEKDTEQIKTLYSNCEYMTLEDNSVEYSKGDNIMHFSKEGKKYSNKELIQKKLLVLKEDEKLNADTDTIEKLTEIELIEKGIKELDKTQKIITLDNGERQITAKTFDELAAENLVPPDELLAHKKQETITRLSQIDIESIRPLRAIADNIATDEDHAILSSLNEEATDLRKLLSEQ